MEGQKGADHNQHTELVMMGRSESREGWRAISTSSDVKLWCGGWRDGEFQSNGTPANEGMVSTGSDSGSGPRSNNDRAIEGIILLVGNGANAPGRCRWGRV